MSQAEYVANLVNVSVWL